MRQFLVEVDMSTVIKDKDGCDQYPYYKIRYDKPMCTCENCYQSGPSFGIETQVRCYNPKFNPGSKGILVNKKDFCSFGIDKRIYVEQPYEGKNRGAGTSKDS